MKEKYDTIKKEQEPVVKLQEELAAVKEQVQVKQNTLDKLTIHYGKEAATLKAKLTQQDAELAVKEDKPSIQTRLSFLKKKL